MLDRLIRHRDPRSLVLPIAIAMIVLALGLRTWASFGAWFYVDDLAFASRVMNWPFGWHMLFSGHSGHLMPSGFFLTWLNFKLVGTWTYWPFAAELIAFQVIADVGFLVFLLSAFGRRLGILPPLALFLFTVYTLPANLWWAVGVNQLPTIAAVGWGCWAIVRYLRTRQVRWAVASAVITLVALSFQERAVLLEIPFVVIALGYFTTGDIVERVKELWARYRTGVVLHVALVAGYAALYLKTAQNFGVGSQGKDQPLLPLLGEMGLHAVVPAALGGPWRWFNLDTTTGFPAPPELLVWPCAALIAFFGYSLSRSRLRSGRAWWLVFAMFGSQVALVAISRSYLVGPQLGRDYRYTTEMGPTIALALALAVMPILGAVERVESRQRSALLDFPIRAAVVTTAITGLAIYSTLPYIQKWTAHSEAKTFFTNVGHDLAKSSGQVPMVNAPLPDNIWSLFAFSYPLNTEAYLLKPWAEHTYFPAAVADNLYTAARDGHVKPVLLTSVRTLAQHKAQCLSHESLDLQLSGPVLGIEWWVRVSYTAAEESEVAITAGDESHTVTLEPGSHTLFFTAQGDGFDSISFQRESGTGPLCVSSLTLGQPYAVGDKAPQ